MLHVVEIVIDCDRQLKFNGVVNISQENCNVPMSQLYFLMLSKMYRIAVFFNCTAIQWQICHQHRNMKEKYLTVIDSIFAT